MKYNFLAFSIPLFILLIYIEFAITKKKKLAGFELHSVISNLSLGILERLLDVYTGTIFYFIYDFLQKNYGLFHIKATPLVWLALLICTDFIWYWYHRLAHEINVLWAVHIVHHQSEEFNFTVSARITVLQAFLRGGFWCVLPLLGFPAPMITVMLLVHGLYPFFIHTKLVGKLGILEYLFVTPSHHRVHHASNEQYLDRNYGDVLIIWDKIFGTFQSEEDKIEIVYGLTKPLNTYDYLWQHFHYFIEIIVAASKQDTIKGKLETVFGKPETLDPTARKEAEKIFHVKQNMDTIQKPLNTYVKWQIGILLSALFAFVLLEKNLSPLISIIFVSLTILTLINCGAIMEHKRWVFNIEFARAFLTVSSLIYFTSLDGLIIATLLFVTILATSYKYLENRYLNLVYRR